MLRFGGRGWWKGRARALEIFLRFIPHVNCEHWRSDIPVVGIDKESGAVGHYSTVL